MHLEDPQLFRQQAFIEWFAEEGKRTYGDVIPSPSADKRLLVVKQGIDDYLPMKYLCMAV